MANNLTSLLLETQAKQGSIFGAPEMREKRSNLIDLFLKGGPSVIQNWDKLKRAETMPMAAYMLNKNTQAVGNVLEATHSAADFGTSTKESLTWTPYVRKFKVSLKAGERNVFNNPEILDRELKSAFIDLHAEIDTDCSAYLAAQKTQVATAGAKAAWDAVNFNFDIADADKDYFFQIAKSAMGKNGYGGSSFDVVADSNQMIKAAQLFANGSQNANNTAFQASNMDIYEDYSMVTASAYFIPTGTIGVLPFIPLANRRGEGSEDGKAGLLTTINDPMGSGLPFGLSILKGRADTSAQGGETQDVVAEFQIHTYLSLVKANLSTANESTILKFDQL